MERLKVNFLSSPLTSTTLSGFPSPSHSVELSVTPPSVELNPSNDSEVDEISTTTAEETGLGDSLVTSKVFSLATGLSASVEGIFVIEIDVAGD